MMLSENNKSNEGKFSQEDLDLIDRLTAEHIRHTEAGGDKLYIDHLEYQMESIMDKNNLENGSLYKTAILQEIAEDNEVLIELPKKSIGDFELAENAFETHALDERTLDEAADELLPEECPETNYYNYIASLYGEYVSAFVENYGNQTDSVDKRVLVADKFFQAFDSRDINNKFKKQKLKELVIDLYRDSIQSGVDLDDFDKAFIKMAMLLQHKNLSSVEKKLKNMKFLGEISHTSEEEFEAMLDIISYRYFGFYEQYVKNINTSPSGHIDIKNFDNKNFDRFLNKFGYLFETDINEEILLAIREKIDSQSKNISGSKFINKTFLRAMALHLSNDQKEYTTYRRKLKLGNADEFELELALPLMKDKMFVFMRYEEELKNSKTLSEKDRKNVIDLSMVDEAEIKRLAEEKRVWEKKKKIKERQQSMREKDPQFWNKLERAFKNGKK